jgi:hypothetical protein
MVQSDAIIWKDPNSNFESGAVSLKNDNLIVTDSNGQTFLSCSIYDPKLTYETFIFQRTDQLFIDLTYKSIDEGIEYTIRPEGLTKEFLKIIYSFEGQSLPENISKDVKLARNPKFMQILSFINIVLIFYIEYVMAENPNIYKIIEIQIGTINSTQYQSYALLIIIGIIMIAFTRILYTKIDGLIRYFQIIGPIKSYSPYTFNQGIKYYRKLSRLTITLVIIDLSILLTGFVILIRYSQFLIGIVLFLLGAILPLKLLYSPIKFLLSKKDLQFYVGDYF